MWSQALNEYVRELNEQQLKVANAGPGQAVVVGTAGSGKTRAIIGRIGRLVADGLAPHFILAMTFTRDAAGEMMARLAHLGIQGVRVGTIHSVDLEILQSHGGSMGQLALDERNRMPLELHKLLNDLRLDGWHAVMQLDREAFLRYVADCKATGPCYIAGDPWDGNLSLQVDAHLITTGLKWEAACGLRAPHLAELYHKYEDRRAARGLMTYDDMVSWTWHLLVRDAGARSSLRGRYSVVIIDEMQDSTPVQWDLAFALTGLESCVLQPDGSPVFQRDAHEHNLMAAGDPNQSIYGWRSAKPEVFVEYAFRKDVRLITLPVSYRCPKQICHVSSGLVRGAAWNLLGEMLPAPDRIESQAEGVSLVEFKGLHEEASWAVAHCAELAVDHGWQCCAVLSRLSVGLHLAEIECIRRRIPYVLMASGSFSDSQDVENLLAYLRVACGADPTGRWAKHIINTPFRMIGRAAITDAQQIAQQQGVSLLDALLLPAGGLGPRQRVAVQDLYRVLQKLNRTAAEAESKVDVPLSLDESPGMIAGPARMLTDVVDRTSYIESIRDEEGLRGMDESRIAVIGELQRMAELFRSPLKFLGYMDALSQAVRMARNRGLRRKARPGEAPPADALMLSTIHRFKGLERDHIVLLDCNKDRFPHARSHSRDEELRLLYVAVTRAAKTCSVTHSKVAENLPGILAESRDREQESPFTGLIRGFLGGGPNQSRTTENHSASSVYPTVADQVPETGLGVVKITG